MVVDGGELENFEAKVGVDGMTELLLVVRGGRELKLVAGVMAMNDGEASGLLEPGENVEDVDNEGDDQIEEEQVGHLHERDEVRQYEAIVIVVLGNLEQVDQLLHSP